MTMDTGRITRRICTFTLSLLISGMLSIGLMFPQDHSATSAEPSAEQVCFSVDELAEIRRSQIDLREEIAKLRAKRLRKFGFTIGPGVGVDVDGEASVGYVYLSWGWRF